MEHAESSRGRTQVEMLASFSQQYAEEKEHKLLFLTSKICIICILSQIISSSCMIYRPATYNRLRARR